jgi:alginate O-acetyltransferase complex protein AlgJ
MNNENALRPQDVLAVYQHLLGREPREEEVGHQLKSAGTLSALLDVVLASEEYRQREGAPAPPAPAPPGGRRVVNTYHPDLARWTFPPGTRSADGVAIVGHDGFLFLCGGTNANLEQFLGRAPMPDDWLDGWRQTFARRERELATLGAQGVTVVVPDKLAVYEEHYPEALVREGLRPVERLQAAGDLPFHYPLASLRAAATREMTFLRTDTHVSLKGNAALYESLAATLACAVPDLTDVPTSPYLTSGDLGSRFDPKVLEVAGNIGSLLDARLVQDNRAEIAAVGGHIGTHRVFVNDAAADKRVVLVFGDSFGFGDKDYQGLTWFLSQTFRDVHFVWVPFGWDARYAEQVGAQVVLFQGAERFLGRVPLPTIDVPQLAKDTLKRKCGLDLSAAFVG